MPIVKKPLPDGRTPPPFPSARNNLTNAARATGIRLMPPRNKHTGAMSELKATIWLMEQGYEVFRNVSPHGGVDIIARHPTSGEMLLIDVKTASYGERTRSDGSIVRHWYCRAQPQDNCGIKFLHVYEDGLVSWEMRETDILRGATKDISPFSSNLRTPAPKDSVDATPP
jgi:Holliday junction resolvase-like predicted endonuclease